MMKLFFSRAPFVLLAVFYIFLSSSPSFAQSGTGRIRGIVSDGEGEALEFASVLLKPSGLYAVTDGQGRFELSNVPSGEVEILIQFYGMQDLRIVRNLEAGKEINIDAFLEKTTFRLDKVVVTAVKSEAGQSTASKISRQAMDHLQTGSLKDIMTLLPGVGFSNPSLSSPQTLSIRSNIGGAAGRIRSLGTSVIVDGSPLSNNSNLQVLSSSISGQAADISGAVSASRGVDIRGLSTDNLESVEIIRGVPSVQYGDLLSGAVIVKSKAGRSPFTLRFKANPKIYQISGAKGFKMGKGLGDLNVSGDYAYNRNELIRDFQSYQRASLNGLWSFHKGKFSQNTSVALLLGRDRAKLNPDAYGREQSWANSIGLRLNTNGSLNLNKGWLKSLNWLMSGSYTNKISHYEATATNALNLYSTAMNSGMTYSNIPGLQVYDSMTGEEITKEAGDAAGVIMPYSYFYMYDIYGDELNAFAKFNINLSKTWNKLTARILAGADFKTDGNLGKGPVYSDASPPFRDIENAASGYRRRSYYDIPFVNQLGVYGENSLFYKMGERRLTLNAGLRFDFVNGLTSLSPRFNAGADIFPWLTLRGGWGLISKAPTSLYLYPNKAYLDAINFNGMSNAYPEKERLLIATTSVYSADNPDLRIAVNRKAELGLDITIKERFGIDLTFYDEYMKNGYSMGLGLPSFIWYKHQTYKETARNPGMPPSITKDRVYNMFFTVYKPYNNVVTRNRGFEYEINLGRFEAIRTAFNINGAWLYGSSTSSNPYFNTRPDPKNAERHIGVYNPEKTTGRHETSMTTFRTTHNIPQIGFVITLAAQAHWYGRSWATYKNDEMLSGYLSYKDGKYHDFNPAMKDDPEFSYLFENFSENRFIVEKTGSYIIFNLNLTKEIGEAFTASFYVNNIFNTRHLDRSESSGIIVEHGIPVYFGFEFKVKI